MYNATTTILFRNVRPFIVILFLSCFAYNAFAQQISSKEAAQSELFYAKTDQKLFWLSSGRNVKMANAWLREIESAPLLGLDVDRAQIGIIRKAIQKRWTLDKTHKILIDRKLTGLSLDFLKKLHHGEVEFDYDELSHPNDTLYINQLLKAKPGEPASLTLATLDCKDPDYRVLKDYLRDSVRPTDTLNYKRVVLAMNYRRFLTANHGPEYIIVNIPAAEAEYYRDDILLIKMRTVVGKKSTPTPTMASHITSIITFPYWNVPFTIGVNEILPKAQKDENYLEQKNFDIVDEQGNVVEESELNLKDYTSKNFPYYFRQSTGEANDLGVIKFNIQNPFSIFLHSTSSKGSFAKEVRFLSHGCIRLEKPLILADALLMGKIDLEELKKGEKDTESKTLPLPVKVPVFIIYNPIKVESGKITFLPDVYGLMKQGG